MDFDIYIQRPNPDTGIADTRIVTMEAKSEKVVRKQLKAELDADEKIIDIHPS